MKHPLVGVVSLFAFGVVLGALESIPLGALFPGAALVGWVALRLGGTRWGRVWMGVFLVTAGATHATWRMAVIAPDELRLREGREEVLATIEGTLVSTPGQRRNERWGRLATNSWVVVECRALREQGGEWEAVTGRVAVSTSAPVEPGFCGGTEVRISGILRRPAGPSAPGLFDYGGYLRWRGIHFELRAPTSEDWERIGLEGERDSPGWADRFQGWARRTLARGLPEEDEVLRLIWAMTLGWKIGLTDEVEEPFMRSGTMHLFAISGLHIALLVGLVVEVLRVAGLPRVMVGIVVLPAVWFYTAATGWQPSAVRATLMVSVLVGSWMAARPLNVLNSLAAAGLLVLLWDPRQLFHAGFQLSFAVVGTMGILVPLLRQGWVRLAAPDPFLPPSLVPWWRRRWEATWEKLAGALAVTVSCWLGSLPLAAWYFNLVTPGSLVANLLVVPLGGAALASSLGSLVCGAWAPMLSEWFNHSAWLWMRLILELSRATAEFPGACWQVRQPPVAALVGWYLGLLAIGCGGSRCRHWRMTWFGLGLLCAGWSMVVWVGRAREERLVVLPLRGGHAVWVSQAGGSTLVDTGDEASAGAVTIPFLKAQGVNRLGTLVLTHGDVRHVGGAVAVAERWRPERVLASPLRFRSGPYRAVVTELKERYPDRWRTVTEGDRGVEGLDIWYPATGDAASRADDGCLVVGVAPGGTRVLLVSDLGAIAQERLMTRRPELRAEIVVCGLADRGEPVREALLERWGTRLLIVADAASPASAKASEAVKERWRRGPAEVWFTSDTGSVEFRWRSGKYGLFDARGVRLGPVWREEREAGGSIANEPGVVAGDEVEDGHADGEAVGHLFEDDGAFAIGGIGIDFDPAINGAGVHDEDIGFEVGHAAAIETVLGAIFADPGEHRLALPFVLNAEEIDDIGVAEGLIDIPADAAAHAFEDGGHEGWGAAEGDGGAEFAEGPDVGPGDAAEEDVPHDGDFETLEGALFLPDGEDIEKGLCGVFVGTVAGIDDAGLEKAGKEVGGSGGLMADDDDVRVHGLEVAGGIAERLALPEGGGVGAEVDDVGGEPLGGEFEADPGAGGRLDEEVDDRFAPEGGDGLDGAGADRLEAARGVEDGEKFLGGKGLDIEEVGPVPGHGARSRTPSSRPSSVQWTSTRCSGRVSSLRAA
ncbi:MAG: ComEC/Rec2 family competence protein [Verrucomicrobiae bacterium]|nr:ComEC/Rec2 family competence protein [Verrucomicrobiae bacterium]